MTDQESTLPESSVELANLRVSSPRLRESILSGIRWTFWLSILSIPFSFGTNLLLARIGPSALGTFGVLTVYIGVVAVFFYVGGNAVLIHFLPKIEDANSVSFLLSYLLILSFALVLLLALVTAWPGLLGLLFGRADRPAFLLQMMYLAPVYILFSFVTAMLKARMQIKVAQVLDRFVPIASFLLYAFCFLFAYHTMKLHYATVVWSIYLGATAIALLIGAWYASRSYATKSIRKWYLPHGFWKYTISLQGSSTLGFFVTRLDLIFVLHAGGLNSLGNYVAVISVATIVTRITNFIVDSFLPSLSNALADKDPWAPRSLTETYSRIVFPIVAAVSLLVLFLARYFLALMGHSYLPLLRYVQIAGSVAALQALNLFLGTIVTISGRPQREMLCKAVRVTAFVPMFWFFWMRYNLLGAVLAWAIAESLQHAGLILMVCYKPSFYFKMVSNYVVFICIMIAADAAAYIFPRPSFVQGMSMFVVTLFLFFKLAGYNKQELRSLFRVFVPSLTVGKLDPVNT